MDPRPAAPTDAIVAGSLLDIARRERPDEPWLPSLPPSIPRRGGALGPWMGRTLLRLLGWKVIGNFPDLPRGVIIVAPHTSNWDFVVGFSAYLALDLHANWFGKHTIFVGPIGTLFRRFGGIPIHRESRAAAQVVDVYASEFATRDRMYLAIAPEGTRKKVAEWKSGFYRIAHRAAVPIVPVALDFGRSRVIIGEPFTAGGDWEADKDRIRALYDGITARYPAQF